MVYSSVVYSLSCLNSNVLVTTTYWSILQYTQEAIDRAQHSAASMVAVDGIVNACHGRLLRVGIPEPRCVGHAEQRVASSVNAPISVPERNHGAATAS